MPFNPPIIIRICPEKNKINNGWGPYLLCAFLIILGLHGLNWVWTDIRLAMKSANWPKTASILIAHTVKKPREPVHLSIRTGDTYTVKGKTYQHDRLGYPSRRGWAVRRPNGRFDIEHQQPMDNFQLPKRLKKALTDLGCIREGR
ncbi:MAG: hypothetical protein JEZ11_24915 [Desulfobacterales bacterium]|nr:hypothetical protein [Desulfobacterales bacterium]